MDTAESWLRIHSKPPQFSFFSWVPGAPVGCLWNFPQSRRGAAFPLGQPAFFVLRLQGQPHRFTSSALTLLLYYWRALGTSELWLRLLRCSPEWLFVGCFTNGSAMLRESCRLHRAAFRRLASADRPTIGGYAAIPLLLAFLAERSVSPRRSFREKICCQNGGFTLCLYLAMLSHYSAFLFAAALGIYAVLRIFRERRPPAWRWFGQSDNSATLALAILSVQDPHFEAGVGESRTVLQGWMSEFFLRHSYFDSAHDNPLLFLVGHSFGVFQYFFGQLAVGDAIGILFVVGGRCFCAGKVSAYNQTSSRRLGIFLLLPFVVACGASLAHVYPYGGTRHIAFLMIPGVAGVGIAVDQLMDQRWFRAVGFAGLDPRVVHCLR